MHKRFLIIYFLLFLKTFLFGKYIITNSGGDFLPVILFKPIENISDTENYPASDQFANIFMGSIKNHLKPLKNFNVVYSLKDEAQANIVIKGDYSFSGDSKSFRVDLSIRIFDNRNGSLIFTRKYKSFNDRRLFDTVDEVKNDITEFCRELEIFSPESKEEDFGTIHFKNFNVGKENYFLYIDERVLSKYVSKTFERKVKLKAQTNYIVRLVRESDERVVFEKVVFLEKDKTVEIEYEGKGNLMVSRLKNPEMWRTYQYFLDGIEIFPEKVISNLSAGHHHKLIVKDNRGKDVYSEIFYLEDGETKILNPYLSWDDVISIKFFSVLSEYWAIGFEYNFCRYFWGGVNLGFNSFYEENLSLYFLFTTAEAGYFYFVDSNYNFKAGVGLLGQIYFSLEDIERYNDRLNVDSRKAIKNGASLFLDFELFNLFIKPGVFYDLESFYFQISLGLKLNI